VRYRALIERVMAGRSADTCPVAFWQHQPVADQETQSLVEATLAFQVRFDCDLVKISPASTFQLRDYGLTDAWRGDALGRREIGPGIIHTADDWAQLPTLDPEQGFVARHVACAREVRRRLPDDVPVIQTVFNPVFQAAALCGDRWTEHLRAHADAVQHGLGILTRNTVRLIEALREVGVDGIYLVSQHARAGAMTASEYLRIALGADRACLDASAAMPLRVMHLHGSHVFAAEATALPIEVLHLAEEAGNPSSDALLTSGSYTVCTGPGQDGLIHTGTAEQAAQETAAVLRRLKGPRFILGAGCVLALDTPGANVRAAIAEARRPRPDRTDA